MFSSRISRQVGSSLWAVCRHVKSRYVWHQCKPCSPYAPFTETRLSLPSHRKLTTSTSSNGTSECDDKSADTKRNLGGRQGKFQKKLHSRVFTEEELAQNEQFKQSILSSRTEDEVFGTLQRKERRVKASVKPFKPSSAFDSDLEADTQRGTSAESTVERRHTFRDLDTPRHRSATSSSAAKFEEKGRKARHRYRWGDRFGTLQEDDIEDRIQESLSTSVGSHEERFSDDEDEVDSRYIRLSKYNRRHIPEWYGRRILKLGKSGEIRQAIEVFEDWMLKQDRVMPNSYVFTCIITVLGRAGYTQKAFSLFNKMKKMGIEPKPATYTALFNACANSPWRQDGRARADSLFRLMKEKEVEPTFITGKAMVKAFAMCGDLGRAFVLMDELSQIYRPDPEAFSFLLMACISDKETGLRHAIQVWRLMHEMGVQPDLPLYNLLIRCTRDCGVGDAKSLQTLLTRGAATEETCDEKSRYRHEMASGRLGTARNRDRLPQTELEFAPKEEPERVLGSRASSEDSPTDSDTHEWDSETDSHFDGVNTAQATSGDTDPSQLRNHQCQPSSLTAHNSPATIPDVLSPVSDTSRVVALGDLHSKENRLALLGGVDGILSRMSRDGVKPDIITFSQLISVATPTTEAEAELLAAMKSVKVNPDIDLVNALIHKRCMRKDFAAAKEARKLIEDHGLTANQRTYGVLAMACKTHKDGAQLLKDMEAAELAPNVEIMGTLMYAAGMNFYYKLWVLQQAQKWDLKPNAKFLQNVENSFTFARRSMVDAEKKDAQDSYYLSAHFQDSIEKFVQRYEAWLRETRLEVPPHPWASFKPQEKENKGAASV